MEIIQTEIIDDQEHHTSAIDYKTAETFGMIVVGLTIPEVTFPELADSQLSTIDTDNKTLYAA